MLPPGVQTGFKEQLPPRKAGRASPGPPTRGCIQVHTFKFFVLWKRESACATGLPPLQNQRLAAATATQLTRSRHHIEAASTLASSESRRNPRCCLLGTLLIMAETLPPHLIGFEPPLRLSNSDHLPSLYSSNSSAKHLLQEALPDHLPNPSGPPILLGAHSKCNNCYHMGFCVSASTCHHH